MRDTDWLEPADDQAPGSGSRWPRPLLVLLAGLPWVVVVGLLVVPGRLGVTAERPAPGAGSTSAPPPELPVDAPTGAPTDAPTDAPDAPATGGVTTPPPPEELPAPVDPAVVDPRSSHADVPGLELTELGGGWRVEPGVEEAMALAVVAGRAWVTGVEPTLRLGMIGPGRSGDYAEHLVVEAVEQPTREFTVVTLLAVVLRGDTATPQVRRFAVPLATTPLGPRLAGRPWDLPPPELEPVELAREPIEDPAQQLDAQHALAAVGLGDRELVALHGTPGWPVIAELRTSSTASADASEEADTDEVWLRRHLDGFVVAGTTLTTAGPAAASVMVPTEDGR